MQRQLGLDLGVTAESRACLADESGDVLSERRFRISRSDLDSLYEIATEGMGPEDTLLVVMEPTGNCWIAPASFFQSKGARVHLVPPEQAADLRNYYTKHVKNDRIDAKLLARLPLLHPDGLHEVEIPKGAGGTLRRVVGRRSRLVREISQHRQRVRSLLNWAMLGMNEVLGEELGKAALALLGRYGNPKALVRLGKARMAALLVKASRGMWREEKAEQILGVARSAIALWDGLEGCDFDELSEDLAVEARLIKALEAEIRELDAKAAGLLAEVDPGKLHLSLPGFGEHLAAAVAGRLGDASRFRNSPAVRSYIGVIPATDQSGESEARVRPTKSGDRILRTSLFLAADAARQLDPQLARIYFIQVVEKGNHHTKAVCAVATALATRLAAVLREGRPYVVCDVDGSPVDRATAKRIIAEHYTVPAPLRIARRNFSKARKQRRRHLDGVRSKVDPSPPAEAAPGIDGNAMAHLA